MLKSHKSDMAEQRLKLGNKWVDEDNVFARWNGALMSVDSLSRWWSEFLKRNGLKKIAFHDLRHTVATLLLTSNTDIASVSGMLGHSRQSTTLNIYSHVIEGMKNKAANTLDAIVEKSRKTNM